MKKKLLFALCILVPFIGCNRTQTPEQSLEEDTVELQFDTLILKEELKVSPGKIVDFDMNILLPQEDGSEAVDSIRDAIMRNVLMGDGVYGKKLSAEQMIQNQKLFFVKELKDFEFNDPEYPTHWSYNVCVKLEKNTASMQSYSVNCDSYMGGAHGSYYFKTMNFDLASGKLLGDDDIWILDSTERDLIAKELLLSLKEYCKDPQNYVSMQDFEIENVKPNGNFRLQNDSIFYHYNIYEIACYAVGAIDISIPMSRLRKFTRKDCPFWE